MNSIGVECYSIHPVIVPTECEDAGTEVEVPDFDFPIPGAGYKHLG
jgi:hypothetical protein